jgi:hypothetical protein
MSLKADSIVSSLPDYILNAPQQGIRTVQRFFTGEAKNNIQIIQLIDGPAADFLKNLKTQKKEKGQSVIPEDIIPYLTQVIVKTKNGDYEYPKLVFLNNHGNDKESVAKITAACYEDIFKIVGCRRPSVIRFLNKIQKLQDVPNIASLTTLDDVKNSRIGKLKVDISWLVKELRAKKKKGKKDKDDTHIHDDEEEEDDLLGTPIRNARNKLNDISITKEKISEVNTNNEQISSLKERLPEKTVGIKRKAVALDDDPNNFDKFNDVQIRCPDSFLEPLGIMDILRNPDALTNPHTQSSKSQDKVISDMFTDYTRLVQAQKHQAKEPYIDPNSIIYALHYAVEDKNLILKLVKDIIVSKHRAPIADLENNYTPVWKDYENDTQALVASFVTMLSTMGMFEQLFNPNHNEMAEFK